MPIYEYQCKKCSRIFDYKTSFIKEEQEPNTKLWCPDCGSPNNERIYEIPTVIYKGSGFYTTDK